MSQATPFPSTVFDPVSRDRLTYNISRCTGGYIRGVNVDTWKSWNAQVAYNGRIKGKDIDGDRWAYDPKTGLYTNFASGRTCAQTNIRMVCPK